MRAITAVFALLPISVVLGDIDRTLWRTPAEIDSSGSREYVAERGSAVQQRSLEKYRREIAACDHRPPTEAIPILLRAVSKLPRYNIHQLRERIEVFDLARDKLLTLPGHAQYYADLIENERAALKPGEYRDPYDNHRFLYLRETLSHLPSPETVKVLGHYLDDDRDTPTRSEKASDGGASSANSIIAMDALLLLELRDAPYPPGRYYAYWHTAELEVVRKWFAPIKSGGKSFSFRGQAVEHRFNPDGTWVSTPMANPPIDPPYPAKPKLIPAPPAPANIPAASTAQVGQPVRWFWLGGGLLVGLGILLWQIKIHSTRKSA